MSGPAPTVPAARDEHGEQHPLSELIIRRAAPEDAAAIGRIYDEGIADGIATFATGPHNARERRGWLAARPERAPVWCGVIGGEVVAWSALAPFSHRPWYDGVAEYTTYVAHGRGGRGIGGRMLHALIAEAPAFGYWKLVGMILADNAPGLALARAAGFRVVGTHLAHGRQGERWRDVTVVELHLAPPAGDADRAS
jgi:L-amino acid N-acyltransferase YncA